MPLRFLVTGSAGHLGEALLRTLRERGIEGHGIDLLPSAFTAATGSISDRGFVREAMSGITAVLHTATLHKPHVATHSRQAFVDTNISGTLNLVEEAAAAGVQAFVCTSTTSTFGDAMKPPAGAPAVWVDEQLQPQPKNIYGVSKLAAEELCTLMHRLSAMPCIVLRTSRFFPEDDDDAGTRAAFGTANQQANELLYRRVDIEDVVEAHLVAAREAPRLGCGRFIVSATTPFERGDVAELGRDLAAVLSRRVPGWQAAYAQQGWALPQALDRVYDNRAAREVLGWQPQTDFVSALQRLQRSGDIRSPLARAIGRKGYHAQGFSDGPYPV